MKPASGQVDLRHCRGAHDGAEPVIAASGPRVVTLIPPILLAPRLADGQTNEPLRSVDHVCPSRTRPHPALRHASELAPRGVSSRPVGCPAMTDFVARPRPADLPDFSDPPVDEVVIGLMFMSVGSSTNHVAKYRDSVKNDFPGLQYQPRLVVQFESLSEDAFSAQTPNLVMGSGAFQPGQRTWFVSADDQRLLQLQDDAFLSNWRRRGQPYPRFEPLLRDFWARFELFRMHVNTDSPIPLQLQQLEVSYINWVPFDTLALDDWFQPARASSVSLGPEITLRPEHSNWNAAYLIRADGVAIARLHARQLEALRTGPGVPHLGAQLELIFRAPLAPGTTDDEITDLAFDARNTIVRAFDCLTTTEAHKRWAESELSRQHQHDRRRARFRCRSAQREPDSS